jgi:cell division protein FtsB
MNAIASGKKPHVSSKLNPALKQVIERGWALDPKQRPTMAEVCGILAAASWCVFPGADPKKVAEAELELPIDATASPATVALRVEKLEAENSALKSENAVLKAENAQIPTLNAAIAKLKGENATMKAENAQIPALKAENSQIPALKTENTKLKSENAGLKAEIDRLKAAPAPAKPTVVPSFAAQVASAAIAPGTLLAENAQAVESLQVKLQVAELLLTKAAGERQGGDRAPGAAVRPAVLRLGGAISRAALRT